LPCRSSVRLTSRTERARPRSSLCTSTGIVVIGGFATTLKCVDCHAAKLSVAL
jgi:hypothetical protein